MKIRGFTLIEMIITIVVIIILSSISVPMYKGYKKNAIMAEGYVLLGVIRNAQLAYYNRYRNFLYYAQSSAGNQFVTCNDEVLGIDARGNKYFTEFSYGYQDGCGKIDHYFGALATIPSNVRQQGSGWALMLQYNISLGQKFGDINNYDQSWWK